jgi:hypothetical protein
MYDSRGELLDCAKGDIEVGGESFAGLAPNRAFRPEVMDYADYHQSQHAVSAVFSAHLNELDRGVDHLMAGQSIIVLSFGKGYSLEELEVGGFDLSGYDPTYEGSNPQIMKHNFSPVLCVAAEGLVLHDVLARV